MKKARKRQLRPLVLSKAEIQKLTGEAVAFTKERLRRSRILGRGSS